MQRRPDELEEQYGPGPIKQLMIIMGWLGLLLLLFLNFLPWFAQLDHKLELLAHFRVQFALLSLIPVIWFALCKRTWGLVLSLLLVGWNAFDLLPWYFPDPARFESPASQSVQNPQKPQPASSLKILMSNMLFNNHDTTRLEQLIQSEKPDVVIVQELSPSHLALMDRLKKQYPHSLQDVFQPAFGLGIWSRLPLASKQEVFLGPSQIPSIYAAINWNGEKLHLLTTHPYPPVNIVSFQERNAQYLELVKFLKRHNGAQVLIGDLNVTPWSPYYRQLERDSGLRNARRGFGLLPSWPSHFNPLMRIPIDHALVSPSLNVTDFKLGPDLGSDHLPIILSLSR